MAGLESTIGKEQPHENREEFRSAVVDQLMLKSAQEWKETPLASRDAMVDRMYGHKRLEWLAAFRSDALPIVRSAKTTLGTAVQDVDAQRDLDRIYEALIATPPPYGTEPNQEHPYLYSTTVDPLTQKEPGQKLWLYHVNRSAVQKDLSLLATMKKGMPGQDFVEARKAIDQLATQLQTYMYSDPKLAVEEAAERRIPKGMMGKGIKEMGHMGLTAILTAGTVIFGTVAVVNFIMSKGKNISLAPFIWGLAAYLTADPGIVRSFFEPRYQRNYEEIAKVTSARNFVDLRMQYNIQGNEWKTVVERMYERNDAVQRVLSTPSPTAKNAQEAASVLATDKVVQKTLITMMHTRNYGAQKTHFGEFMEALDRASSNESRSFIANYIAHNGTPPAPR